MIIHCVMHNTTQNSSDYNAPKASFASNVYATGGISVMSVRLSVCPPVCPSHSGIVSKRGNAEGCGLHHWVAQCP